MTTAADRFDPAVLIERACEWAGSDDFGADFDANETWRDGLARLCGSLAEEARLNDLGVEIATLDVVRPLKNRLQIVAWRKAHPEIAEEAIQRPIFIVGQPRTGTTILFDLLAQDPELRPPLTWEVDGPASGATARHLQNRSADRRNPSRPGDEPVDHSGIHDPASDGCKGRAGVCPDHRVAVRQHDLLRSVSAAHLLQVAAVSDHHQAYPFHRIFLQHLQSGVSGQWLLKSPAHLWTLDTLVQTYPDALIVQTHRDPLKVISSISALTNHLRRMASDDTSVADCAVQSREEIVVGLQRGMTLRESLPSGQVIDVQFAEFMRDPFATIRSLYGRMDRQLTPVAERRMREHLAAHPGDGSGGRYTWADTGLDAAQLREQVAAYQEHYDVPTEPMK